MAALTTAPMAATLQRLLPATLFGRLALLLLAFVLVSHVLALSVMFGLVPPPPPSPGFPPRAGPPPMMHVGLLLDIGVRLGALTLAAWIAASWLSRPMKRLAAAAHDVGRNIGGDRAGASCSHLVEEGPLECREAARVFNRMQAQIRQQFDERDRFVAAVSHDLRTPLTRLRLRAESLADAGQQAQFRQDIGEMDQMISATLDYLRGAATAEATVRLDVQALAESLAEDQQACGHEVRCVGRAAPLPAQASALRRCLCNLVDNAVRYGGSAHLQLIDSATDLRIEVRDHGPGIAPDELDKVLAPFYRIEGSRNRQHGGVGLGLSIAHDIARQHGGTLTLRNAGDGGLIATLSLPR
ncbi:MAG: ATP-binding protein [Burkholderiaceae bacterium]|nr:ATP-binding protein [Burkholderiaceae bacterium]